MVKFRAQGGGTLNMRGLRRHAETAQYESSYELGGFAERGARLDVPTETGSKARRLIARLRHPDGR